MYDLKPFTYINTDIKWQTLEFLKKVTNTSALRNSYFKYRVYMLIFKLNRNQKQIIKIHQHHHHNYSSHTV